MTALTLRINGRAYGTLEVRDEPTINDFLREASRADRHEVRLWLGAMPELCGDRR
jgi:hypothetical protein